MIDTHTHTNRSKTGATKVIKEGEGEKRAGGENWVREDALSI